MRFIPRWRKATWALAIFNVLMLIWVISGAATASGHATGCGTLDQATCDAARNVGTGIGVALLVVLWFIGFLVLSLVWLMSRPRRRQCPRCGNDVRKGLTVCTSCSYDFAAVLGSPPAGSIPGGTAGT